MVSSNYDFSATVLSEDVHGGYMVEAGGIKVGFVGLGVRLSGLVSPLCCAGVEYEAPVDVAETAAAELRKNGADLVIGLSHLGYSSKSDAPYLDRGFVMNTSSVDMIIGGHTHTYMPVADYVTNLSGRRVPIVQTGSRGYSLGYAKVVIPESGNPSFTYRLIPVDSRLDNRIDPVFASQLSAYSDELASFVEQVIGYSDRVMYTGNPQGLLGNWTTDAMVQMCEDFFGVRPDMAVYNNGGLRAPMPAGNVKVADIYATYPFDNTMTLLHISGSQILGLCDVVASGGYAVGGAVKMTIRDGRTVSVEINGKAVDPSAEYKVVTINYLADDKVQAFNNPISRDDTPDMIRDLFVEYVKKLSEAGKNISAAYDDRIVEL
ncbi:MAG: bifunctional metallophosphatase/5'-nucleotidase, partial [Candidatus Cryptobacteroides sp.]